MSELKLYLLDNSNKIIEEVCIPRPNSYKDLLDGLNQHFKQLSHNFKVFYSSNNIEEEILNEDDYQSSNNIIYISQKKNNNLLQSIFTRNYNKLPESKQEIFNEKYSCSICSDLIKDENPYLCYICQKIFHHKCLEDWAKSCCSINNDLSCPNCRNILPLNKWKTKLDFEEIRKNDSALMNLLNERETPLNLFMEKTSNFCRNIINRINEIHSLINDEENIELENLRKELDCNFIAEPPIDDLSYVISKELDFFIKYIKNKNIDKDKEKDNKEIQKKNICNEKDTCKNDIVLTYYNNWSTPEQSIIFSYEFVNNNKDNINILVNGVEVEFKHFALFEVGYNEVKMIIKNKLTDLSHMFDEYNIGLRNINGLKYLDTSNVTNFSNMFGYLNKLKDITPLSNWDVSKGIDFSYMFRECESLSDIEALENWNVSNGTDFEGMFFGCSRLKNIKPLQNWNVSKSNNFAKMFKFCKQITNIKPLENWDLSNVKDLHEFFCNCSVSNIKPLKNWNVGNCENFKGMLYSCQFNSVKPLENWNISKGKDFLGMLFQTTICPDLKPIMKWKVSKELFKEMRNSYKVEKYYEY